jgi:peptidase inhibitor family I36
MKFLRARRACTAGLLGIALLTVPAITSTANANMLQTQTPVLTQVSGPRLAPAIPMSAADCPSTNFCGWRDANFSGPIFLHDAQVQGTDQWLGLPNSNNIYSSIYNNRAHPTLVANSASNPYQVQACIPIRSSYANLANFWYPGTSTNMNDSISAIDMLGYDPPNCT